MKKTARGVAEMTAAMTISGTIGMFVVLSDQPVMNIVFWRCAIGSARRTSGHPSDSRARSSRCSAQRGRAT